MNNAVKSMTVRPIGLLLSACLSSTGAHAAGFALANQSGSGTGNAYAGAAAAADDASTVWFNPAGMTELPAGTHTSVAAHIISPKADFTNQGSRDPLNRFISGKNDDGGKLGVVPNAYLVRGKGERLRFGMGINAPFGLGTQYDNDWVGRYHTLESEIKTINFNPSLAYKINDKVSVGAGLNVQKIEVELKSAIDSQLVCLGSGLPANTCIALSDGNVTIKGDDTATGFNAGMLFKPSSKTRVGVSYRSGMKYKLKGNANFNVPNPIAASPRFASGDVVADLKLPANLSLSFAHKLNPKVELMGDVTRTRWSSFDKLQVNRTADDSEITNQPQNWKDSNRYSLGVNYQYNDRLKLRTGIAYDETPVPNAQLRSARTPDNNRTWLAFGANYKINKRVSADVGYAHIFIKKTPIDNRNNIDPARAHVLSGEYDSNVNILSAQFNWTF